MAWKKPKFVQQIQNKAQSAANTVAAAPPKILQATQNAVQKAGNAVGNVVRPAAQAVAKEVGHVVNPIAGEVALRAKNLVNSKDVKIASNQIGDAIRSIPNPMPLKVPQANASDNGLKEIAPFFTKIVPNAIGDVAKGTARVGEGLVTFNGDKIASGAGMVGRGTVNPIKHGIMGALPFLNAATRNTEPTMGGGRSGGAATSAIPVPAEDTDDIPPPGAQGNSKIGVPRKPNDGTPIPPVPTVGSYLKSRPMPAKKGVKLRATKKR